MITREWISFQGQRVLHVENEGSEALFSPEHGGRILRWQAKGAEIIRWPASADWSNPVKIRGGNPVLFPFIARHMVGGVIGKWRDTDGTVRDLPMHGFARNAKFELVDTADSSLVTMRLFDTPETRKAWPGHFIFDVSFRVEPDRLTVTLALSNTGPNELPYYAGHHFYLALPHEQRKATRLYLPAKEWGCQREDGSIEHFPATASEFTLDDPGLIDRYQIHPTGQKITLAPFAGGTLSLDLGSGQPWYAVTTWTENAESDFYCVEPWLGLPNAIHHGEGLRRLAPGRTERAVCSLILG
jgi:galactose mutarotase-like enzyme